MEDFWIRFAANMWERLDGPLKFRFILQPMMALIFATIAGLKDAKAGKAPYFWSILSEPGDRRQTLRDGWEGIGKVFLLALGLDVVFQLYVLKTVYVGEALIVAFVLAILPYVVFRGLVTRLARRRLPPK